MRYTYAITSALLLGGAAATLALQSPVGAQTAQNEPGAIQAQAPQAGAPMSFADMVARLQPAVVNISTTQRVQVNANPFAGTPFADLFGGGQGARPVTREAQSLGSGFIVSADGYVVTNNHVISADGNRNAVVESITVTLNDRTEYTARVVGRDPASDLAVLKVEGRNLPFVRFGDSSQARVGDWVVAIGNPFGLGGSVTAGIISAVNRVGTGNYDKFIQTDASINRGNSGGPLFDLRGNVIGINSQILSPTGGNVGIGFAIPAEQASPIVQTLMRGQAVQRGYLGIGIQPLTPDIADAMGLPKDRGELIQRVEPGEAADKAGIKQGDVIVKVGGKDVTPDQNLSSLIAAVKPGERVQLEVIRADGRRQTITATVGTRPPEEQLAGFDPDAEQGMPDQGTEQNGSVSLGLNVTPLTPQIARSIGVPVEAKGVVVVSADPASDAAAKGLRRGDLIVSVNRTPVASAADITRIVGEAKAAGRNNVLLYVQRRGGVTGYVAVTIDR